LLRISTSFWLLSLTGFLTCCSEPRYLVEADFASAEAVDASRIAILDSTATLKINELRNLYHMSADSLVRQFADSLSSIDSVLTLQDKPISQAERRLHISRGNYAAAFKEMQSFMSFGGNPIFESSDRKVSTKDLLEDISDRFYRGKAFSLETGRQIRSKIRSRLVPAESRVARTGNRLAQLKRERKADETRRDKVAGKIAEAKAELLEGFNRRVIDRLAGAIIREVTADSAGIFSFDRVPPGRFHLYRPSSAPTLVEVLVDGHLRVRLSPTDPSPLIQERG
jgi:hypothetical protein